MPVDVDLIPHLRRLWPDRNDDRVHVFASGAVHDRAARRRSVRLLIGMIRRGRVREREETLSRGA